MLGAEKMATSIITYHALIPQMNKFRRRSFRYE